MFDKGEFQMKARKENGKLYLIPETDLTAARVEELRDFFSTELKNNPNVSHVLLDVSGVDFVDSLGVNLIVGLYRQADNDSKTIEIINAGSNFQKVAAFFRLSSLFPVRGKE